MKPPRPRALHLRAALAALSPLMLALNAHAQDKPAKTPPVFGGGGPRRFRERAPIESLLTVPGRARPCGRGGLMYNPSPYSPRQEVTTPDAVSIPRCLRALGSQTPALPDTRYPARGNSLKQHRSRHATLRKFSTRHYVTVRPTP